MSDPQLDSCIRLQREEEIVVIMTFCFESHSRKQLDPQIVPIFTKYQWRIAKSEFFFSNQTLQMNVEYYQKNKFYFIKTLINTTYLYWF